MYGLSTAALAPPLILGALILTPDPQAPPAPRLTRGVHVTTPTDQQTTQLAAQAKTEATEIQQDIKETQAEAAAARQEGDTERADRLEKRVEGMETKLDDALKTLKQLAERPFHPAPEEKPADKPAAEEKPAEDKPAAETPPAEDKPTAKRRTASRTFFGSRVDEE